MTRAVRVALALAVLPLTGCQDAPKINVTSERLARAEAAMEECKQRVGLADVATPTSVVLDDPATRGQAMTPELANQLRLKVQCQMELNELLAARSSP